jgi:hypothetical protein
LQVIVFQNLFRGLERIIDRLYIYKVKEKFAEATWIRGRKKDGAANFLAGLLPFRFL